MLTNKRFLIGAAVGVAAALFVVPRFLGGKGGPSPLVARRRAGTRRGVY